MNCLLCSKMISFSDSDFNLPASSSIMQLITSFHVTHPQPLAPSLPIYMFTHMPSFLAPSSSFTSLAQQQNKPILDSLSRFTTSASPYFFINVYIHTHPLFSHSRINTSHQHQQLLLPSSLPPPPPPPRSLSPTTTTPPAQEDTSSSLTHA